MGVEWAKSRSRFWHFLSFIMAASMLAAVIWQSDSRMLATGLRQTDWLLLSLAPLSYLLTMGFRAARFRLLLDPSSSAYSWYRTTALHNFYFTFVPFKLGEASFFPLTRNRGIPASEAAMALAWSRAFELTMLLLFGLVGVLGLGLGESAFPLAVLFVLLSLALLRVTWIASGLTRLAQFSHEHIGGAWSSRLVSAFKKGNTWLEINQRQGFRFLLLTFGTCVTASFSLAFCLAALGYWVTVYEAMFLIFGLSLLGLLGVFTVAGLGVSELGLAALLMLIGFNLVEATTMALLTRLFLLTATLVGTGLALLIAPVRSHRRDD